MPFDASGNFTRVHSWQQDRDSGIRILADRHDAEDDNFGNAFNLTFLRTGTVPMTGNLQMGGNSIKNIDAGSEAAPAMTFELSNQTGIWQPNATSLAFSSGGVKKFEVNSTGVGIFGDTAFNGNTTFTGDVLVLGNADAHGSLWADDNIVIRDKLNDRIAHLGFVNAANDAVYGNIGFQGGTELGIWANGGSIKLAAPTTVVADLAAPKLIINGVANSSFYIYGLSATNPVINFDANDWVGFNQTTNVMSFNISGTSVFSVTPTGINSIGRFQTGEVRGDSYYVNGVTNGNAFWSQNGATRPLLNFDVGDYIMYDQPTDIMGLAAGGQERLQITPTRTLVTGTNPLNINDTLYGLYVQSGAPTINFDSNDYIQYARTNDTLTFSVGGAVKFSLGVNAQFNVAVVSNTNIQSKGSGGGVTLVPGDSAQTGYVAFNKIDGSRTGYIGFMAQAAGGSIAYQSETGGSHNFGQKVFCPSLAVTDGGGTGRNIAVGDDAWIGDVNIANCLGIRGQGNFNAGFVTFGNTGQTLGNNGTDGILYYTDGITSLGGKVTANNGMISSRGAGSTIEWSDRDNNNNVYNMYGILNYIHFWHAGDQYEMADNGFRSTGDINKNLGDVGKRWANVFCQFPNNSTSDARQKDWRGGLDATELAVAKDLVKEIGVFRWLNQIEKEGDDAKYQIGMVAQKIIEVFDRHSLDWHKYQLVRYDEWPESTYNGDYIRDENGEPVTDENGTPLMEQIVKPAGNEYSVSYNDLTLFMMVAMDQRLAYLEGYGERK